MPARAGQNGVLVLGLALRAGETEGTVSGSFVRNSSADAMIPHLAVVTLDPACCFGMAACLVCTRIGAVGVSVWYST